MAKFKIPADVSELDSDALAASVEEALAAFSEFAEIPDAEVTDEQFAEMTALHEYATGAQAEIGNRQAAADARAEHLAAVRQDMAAVGKPVEEGSPAEEEAETPAEEAAEPADPNEEEVPPKPAPKATAASRRSFTAQAAATAPVQKGAVKAPSGSLTAAADVSGFAAGHKFSNFADASEAIMSRLRSLPTDGRDGHIRNSALVINLPESKFTQKTKDSSEMLLEVASESRLSGGSLIAAGGWGAPSEHTLDFCELENLDGLISLPEIQITRGGIQWTKGPTFADVNESALGFWDMTEAVAEAGTELKTFIRPEVPDFTERRLDAVGIGMEAGLLLRQGWPELVDRYAKLLATAHQLKLAKKSVAQIEAFTGAAINVTNGFGNAFDLLHVVELIAIGERQRLAMSTKQTLEALIPHWAKAVIRADFAQRKNADVKDITDAQIDAFFTTRNIKVQWLNAYQDVPLDPTTGLALTYPDTLEVILYPAGTYVRGVAPVIKLDTIYDSALLAKNDYVHLFMEQGVLMTNPCGEGRRIKLPFIATGSRAADVAKNTGLFNA